MPMIWISATRDIMQKLSSINDVIRILEKINPNSYAIDNVCTIRLSIINNLQPDIVHNSTATRCFIRNQHRHLVLKVS